MRTAELTSHSQRIAQKRWSYRNVLRDALEGKLVKQNPQDEPASVLLERIRTERTRTKAGSRPRLTQTTHRNRVATAQPAS